MTDKFVPVFDGNFPEEEGVVPVAMPTRANIETLRDRGEYLLAFRLQQTQLTANAVKLLHDRGVEVRMAEFLARYNVREVDPDELHLIYVGRVLARTAQFVREGKLEVTPEVRRALEILMHFQNLSAALTQISDPDLAELWAASVLSASSMGFTVGKLWGDEFAEEFKPAEEFAGSMHSKGGKARAAQRAWWWPHGLERCNEKRAADPSVRTSELVRVLKRQFKPLLDKPREERPKDARDLPESDAGWRAAIEAWEASGDLPRRQA